VTTNDFSQQLVLQQLIQGAQITQALYVVAKLGIADLLKDASRSSEELAEATATHAFSLYRLLRLLTAVGILIEEDSHHFALTSLGSYLQTDVPGSMRNAVLFAGEESSWRVLGALLYSVETGDSACKHVLGVTHWEYTAQHPEIAKVFNKFMMEWTARIVPEIITAYDFSATVTLVDVGGGHGRMLASILQAYPTLHGVLFDLPHVVKDSSRLLEAAEVSDRCEVISGDVFTGVPAGYDAYLLSRVIHDWDDESALAILTRCYQAMRPRGKVLLVERVILTGRTPELLVLEADIQMLFGTGGKERTDAEYCTLLKAAGFECIKLIPMFTPFYIIEAVRTC
jgi:hypothetical protein